MLIPRFRIPELERIRINHFSAKFMFDSQMSHSPRCRTKNTEKLRTQCARRIVMMMPFLVWQTITNCLTPLVRIYTSQPTPIHLIKSHRNWFSSRCAFHFICLFDVFACDATNRQRLQIITRISTWATPQNHHTTLRCVLCWLPFGNEIGWMCTFANQNDFWFCRAKAKATNRFDFLANHFCGVLGTSCGFIRINLLRSEKSVYLAEGNSQNGNIFYVYCPLGLWQWVQLGKKKNSTRPSHTWTHGVDDDSCAQNFDALMGTMRAFDYSATNFAHSTQRTDSFIRRCWRCWWWWWYRVSVQF